MLGRDKYCIFSSQRLHANPGGKGEISRIVEIGYGNLIVNAIERESVADLARH